MEKLPARHPGAAKDCDAHKAAQLASHLYPALRRALRSQTLVKHVRGAHAPLVLSWEGAIGERLLHPRHTSRLPLVRRKLRSLSIMATLTEPGQELVGFCGVVQKDICLGIRRLSGRLRLFAQEGRT
jgi:hypothetical protein